MGGAAGTRPDDANTSATLLKDSLHSSGISFPRCDGASWHAGRAGRAPVRCALDRGQIRLPGHEAALAQGRPITEYYAAPERWFIGRR